MTLDVEASIREQINREGKITFARFMEMALFSPRGGYYASPHRVGAQGDYFTSPNAHPLFGALLALQLEQMWQLLGKPRPFWVVEMGAGKGLLARDVVSYARKHLPSFYEGLFYVTLERWRDSLDLETQGRVQRVVVQNIPLKGVQGCFLSNELVDSFPVHRFVVEKGRLREIYVTLEEGRWQEVLGDPSTPLLEERLKAVGASLPEGFRGEVNLCLEPWLQEVASALGRGFVITIDYGYRASELYSPQRSRGTLRCYYRHTVNANPYQRIGEQDITAHVDFSALMETGAKYYLEVLGLATQREFLINLGLDIFLQALHQKGLPQRDYLAHRMAIQQLIQPGGLGDFKVLVQGKGVGQPLLYGFDPENAARKRLRALGQELEVPEFTPYHTPLLQGKYPHLSLSPGLE